MRGDVEKDGKKEKMKMVMMMLTMMKQKKKTKEKKRKNMKKNNNNNTNKNNNEKKKKNKNGNPNRVPLTELYHKDFPRDNSLVNRRKSPIHSNNNYHILTSTTVTTKVTKYIYPVQI